MSSTCSSLFPLIAAFLALTCFTINGDGDHEPGKLLMNRPFNHSIPAFFFFGDSTVDPGNNNYVHTVFRSNFHPYGINFVNHIPTGRFCDGRLVTDLIASYAGIKEYVPPYLDSNLSLDDLMTGVSFASAGSGFDPLTPELIRGVIPVQRQLEYFREYKTKLEATFGKERAKTLIRKAAFIISAGTNDIVLNYFGAPFRRKTYDVNTYQQFMLQQTQQFIEGLMEEGAGLIALVGLPPIGCLPMVLTFTSAHRRCFDYLSSVALDYNDRLQSMLMAMQNGSTSLIVYADTYKPLNDVIQNPSQFGFDNVNVGCCGSGLVETTFMCNPGSAVCSNPAKYLFFDSIHPSEAGYSYIFQSLQPTIDSILKKYS